MALWCILLNLNFLFIRLRIFQGFCPDKFAIKGKTPNIDRQWTEVMNNNYTPAFQANKLAIDKPLIWLIEMNPMLSSLEYFIKPKNHELSNGNLNFQVNY